MNNDYFKNVMDSWKQMYDNVYSVEQNPYAKSMNDFFEYQKKYIDALSNNKFGDMSQIFSDYVKNSAFDPKTFESIIEMQKKYFEQMAGFMPTMPFMQNQPFQFADMSKWMNNQYDMNMYLDMFKKYYNPLETGKAFSPAVKDLLEKMMKANTYYLNVYKFWKDIENAQISPAMEEVKKYSEDLAKKYEAMFNDMVMPMLPEEFQVFAKEPWGLFKAYAKTMGDFYAPWTENSKELRDLFVEGVVADKEKLGQFFELWREQFDKTFGAILMSPSFGFNKELIEQQSRAFDTFIEMILLSTDFSSRIYSVQNENLSEMVQKYLEMAENDAQPKTFNEFYSYWSNELEKIFDSYFATPEYSKLIGQLSTAAMEYKIEMRKLTEKYLEDTPIVTRTEINSLYKTVYDLKKEIKALKKAQK